MPSWKRPSGPLSSRSQEYKHLHRPIQRILALDEPPARARICASSAWDGNWTDRPRIVALVVNDDFLMITEGNTAVWSLGSYRTLSKMIQFSKTQNGGIASIHSVVLHPYRFQSFIAQSVNGVISSENLPLHIQNDFAATKVAIRSDTAQGRLAQHSISWPGPSKQATLHHEWSNQADGAQEELEREYKVKLKVTLNLLAGSISRMFGGCWDILFAREF